MAIDPILAETCEIVMARSFNRCEFCGGRGEQMHHRITRGMGGIHGEERRRELHGVSNIVRTCLACHDWLTFRQPAKAIQLGWAISKFSQVPPAEVPAYLDPPPHSLLGRGWFVLTDWGGYEPAEPGELVVVTADLLPPHIDAA